jgi:hypothetical protein
MGSEINGPKMVDAMVERPIGALSERVAQILRSRVFGVVAAREVCDEIKALGYRDLALKFWNAFGKTYRSDDAEIVALINEARAVETKPARAQAG